MEQINELMGEYLELQKQSKALAEQMDEKKERIKLLMNENDLNFCEDEVGNTIKKLSQTRESLDKSRVKNY